MMWVLLQEDGSVSTKQLTVSADNLLTLKIDACLKLSSSVPLGLCSDFSPVSPSSSSAADANSRPAGQKRRVLSSSKSTPVDCERRSCLASGSIDCSRDNRNSNTLCQQLADVRNESDSDATDSTVSSSDSTLPVSRRVTKLPRSGSNITRKKAFYNIKRPVSVFRRDSTNSTSDECVNISP